MCLLDYTSHEGWCMQLYITPERVRLAYSLGFPLQLWASTGRSLEVISQNFRVCSVQSPTQPLYWLTVWWCATRYLGQFRTRSLTRLLDIPLLATVWQIPKNYHLSLPNVDRWPRLYSPSVVLADSPDRGMGKGEVGTRQYDCGAWDGSDTLLGNNHLVKRIYHMWVPCYSAAAALINSLLI